VSCSLNYENTHKNKIKNHSPFPIATLFSRHLAKFCSPKKNQKAKKKHHFATKSVDKEKVEKVGKGFLEKKTKPPANGVVVMS
jgi:hypothetical protein